MARDVAVVYQGVNVGLETPGAEGTPVPPLLRLQSLGFGQIQPQGEGELYRSAGDKLVTGNTPPGNLHATVPFTGKLTYNELGLIYQCGVRRVAPTADGTNGWLWNWYFTRSRPDIKQYLTMLLGNDVSAQRIPYAGCTGFTEETSRLAQNISGEFLGQYLTDSVQPSTNEQQTVTITGAPAGGTFTLTYAGQTTAAIAYNAVASAVQAALVALSNIDTNDVNVTGGPGPGTPWVVEFRGNLGQQNVAQMTASGASLTGGSTPAVAVTTTTPGVAPTEITPVYIAPHTIGVKIADAQADLAAASYFPRPIMASLGVTEIQAPQFYMNPNAPSFEVMLEGAPKLTLTLKVGRQDAGIPLLSKLTSGDKIFVRTESLGPAIAGGTPSQNRWTRDFCGVVIRPYSPDAEGNAATATWVLENIYDPTWGKSVDWTLVNTVQSYAP